MSLTNEELVTELQHLRNNIAKLKEEYKKKYENYQEQFNKYNELHQTSTRDKDYFGRVAGNYFGRKNETYHIIEDLEELLK